MKRNTLDTLTQAQRRQTVRLSRCPRCTYPIYPHQTTTVDALGNIVHAIACGEGVRAATAEEKAFSAAMDAASET